MKDILGYPKVPDTLKSAPVLRGYCDDYEVLTEYGWLAFKDLYSAGVSGTRSNPSPLFEGEMDYMNELKPIREGWWDRGAEFRKQYKLGTPNIEDYSKQRIGQGGGFPRVLSLTPEHVVETRNQTGTLEWVQPEYMTRFVYDRGRRLLRIRKRGVELTVPPFTDLLVKFPFQPRWEFAKASQLAVLKKDENKGIYYSIPNRYHPTGIIGGVANMRIINELVEEGGLKALLTGTYPARVLANGKQVKPAHIHEVYTYPSVQDPETGRWMSDSRRITSVECYNLILPQGSSHTLIVRKRGKKLGGEQGYWKFEGNPIIVGDGYDKTQIPLDYIRGAYNR